MIGECLGEFEASVIVMGHDPGDGAHLLEDREIAVQAGLGQVAVERKDPGIVTGPSRVVQRCDHPPASGRVSMITRAKQACDVVVQEISAHDRQATSFGNN